MFRIYTLGESHSWRHRGYAKSGSFLISSQSPVEYGTLTLHGILAAPQGFSLYVHVHSTMTWPLYVDMAIIRGHGHCTWTCYRNIRVTIMPYIAWSLL